jgi:hypothetical protein
MQNLNFENIMAKNDNERLPVLETKVDYIIGLIKDGFAKIDNEITNLKEKDTANEKQINDLKSEYGLTKSDVSRMGGVVAFVLFAVISLVVSTFWGKLTGIQP